MASAALFTNSLGYHAFAVIRSVGLVSFGYNNKGQLGLGHTNHQSKPQSVAREAILDISCGYTFTLLLDVNGVLSISGALGDGERTFSVVKGLPPIRSLAAGYNHALAVAEDGTLWVVPNSSNHRGQLGLGHSKPCPAVQQVAGLAPVLRAAAGREFTVAEVHGGLLAFGCNEEGQLGSAAGADLKVAQEVPVPDELQWPLRSLACGGDFFAAVDANGTIWTCGGSSDGQLGRAGGSGLARVEAPPMASVATGRYHCIGVTEDGAVWEWGCNYGSQIIGSGDKLRPEAIPLPEQHPVAAVRAGYYSSFAITTEGDLYAVGFNVYGQLGLGDTAHRHVWTRHSLQPEMRLKSAAKSARSARPARSASPPSKRVKDS